LQTGRGITGLKRREIETTTDSEEHFTGVCSGSDTAIVNGRQRPGSRIRGDGQVGARHIDYQHACISYQIVGHVIPVAACQTQSPSLKSQIERP
jgi:hypothetical protein